MNKRRASDVLEICISLVLSGQETLESALARYPEYAGKIRPELEAALWLHRQRKVASARPGYVVASRTRLVTQLKTETTSPVPLKKPGFRWDPALLGLALATIFLFISVFAFRSGAQVVQNSLPGDSAYQMKQTVEEVQLSFASDDAAKAELHIEFANRRAREIQTLVELDRLEDVEVAFVNYRENLSIARDLITNMEGEPAQKAVLAKSLADSVALNNEMFTTMLVAAVDLPLEFTLAVADLIALNDETVTVMVVVLDDLGQPWTPPAGVTLKPTATIYVSPTATNTIPPTNTLVPTYTASPTSTPSPTLTLSPTATWNPLTPTLTATWDPSRPTLTATAIPKLPVVVPTKDDGDEVNPTKEPKPTKVPKPTKTPKDKDK